MRGIVLIKMANYVIDKALLGKPHEKYWITYIKRRIKKNKNFLGFISGQTGSGKSWASLSICEELDPKFDITRCVFGGLELMNLINSGILKRGSAIVFEEAGVEMSNKNWQSITNKMLNYLLQTFRHRGFILIMNSPYMDFVDASTRKLFHAEMQMTGIDKDNKQGLLKPQLMQYNSRLRKFYFKRLKVIRPEGKLPVNSWRVDKPSAVLVEAYETKKREYTDRLNKTIQGELKAVDRKSKKEYNLTDIQKDIIDLFKQGLSVEQIATLRDRNNRSIEGSMKLIRNKGYKLIPVIKRGCHTSYNVIEPEE